jgi:hypothetical protein
MCVITTLMPSSCLNNIKRACKLSYGGVYYKFEYLFCRFLCNVAGLSGRAPTRARVNMGTGVATLPVSLAYG